MRFADFPHDRAAMAIHPCSVGFGWIVFDGPLSPVRWAVSTVAAIERGDDDKNRRCLERIEEHIETYRPPVLVLEEFESKASRRGTRVRKLYRAIISLATVEGIEVRIISRAQISACFADIRARTREQVAERTAAFLPEIRVRLPDKRNAWDAEKPDAALMSAAALLIVHYANPSEPL
jgi:hypothetical protein